MKTNTNHANGRFASAFSKKLKRARRLSGLSQKELGARMGCSTTTISHWEAGVNLPRLEAFHQLVTSLDVSPKRLLPKP
jgi:transcriptional regulator with XRE-family HTH domain